MGFEVFTAMFMNSSSFFEVPRGNLAVHFKSMAFWRRENLEIKGQKKAN
jgi:hypothetical protein